MELRRELIRDFLSNLVAHAWKEGGGGIKVARVPISRTSQSQAGVGGFFSPFLARRCSAQSRAAFDAFKIFLVKILVLEFFFL